MRMMGSLRGVVDAGRIATRDISYKLSWHEIDSAEDLVVYQELNMLGAMG